MRRPREVLAAPPECPLCGSVLEHGGTDALPPPEEYDVVAHCTNADCG